MTTTNDAPAPAPSGSGVRTGAEMIARHRFRLDADNNTAEVDSNGLAEEIDAALSSLASDASPRGEAVAWMDDGSTRAGSHDTAYRVVTAATKASMPAVAAAAYTTPLYAHPAPATVEMREALDWHDGFHAFRTGPCVQDLHTAFVSGWMYRAEQEAALAPATEGRKG